MEPAKNPENQQEAQQEKIETDPVVGEPQVTKHHDSHHHNESRATARAANANAVSYKTRVDMYIQSTGDDEGSEVEIMGELNFPGRPGNYKRIFPKNSSFDGEEGGKGRWVFGQEAWGAIVPPGFTASMYEDDTFGKQWIFKNFNIDFNNNQQVKFADGSEWWWTASNKKEWRFKGALYVTVTPGYHR